MQHVASQASVHHSQPHHGVDPRGRTPASEPKQPTTPFSLLLDSADDAPPPRPKQQDDATKTNEPNRTVGSEPSRSDQTQQQAGQEPQAKPAEDASPASDQTGKPAAKAEEAVVATSTEDDATKPKDDADKTDDDATIVVSTEPVAAVVVAAAQPAPAEPGDDGETDTTALARAAAAAGLKAEQPTAPKGKAAADAGPTDADGSQPAADTPPAGAPQTAEPVEAPKPHGEAHAAPVTPDQDKPEHARVHEAASRGEARGADTLANPQATQASDSAPTTKAADGTQVVNVQQAADRTTATLAPAAAAPNNVPVAVPLAGLAVEIASRAQGGNNHFEIRLDPPELGKIHVSLDVDKSGQVTSRLVVDRAETLDALRRDAANLERALQDAGLKTGDNGLQFTLRDQSFAGRDDGFTPGGAARHVVPDPDLAPVEAAPAGYGRLLRAGGGVDIRV